MQNIYKNHFLVYILLIQSCQNNSSYANMQDKSKPMIQPQSNLAKISNSDSKKKDFKNSESVTVLTSGVYSNKNDKNFNQKKSSIDKLCVGKGILGLAVLGVLIFLIVYCAELKNEKSDLVYQVEGLQNQLYDLQNALNSSNGCGRELIICNNEKESFSKSLLELSASTSNNEKSYKECLSSSILYAKDLEFTKNEAKVCNDKLTLCSSDLEFSKNSVSNYANLLNDCNKSILGCYRPC